MERTKPEVISPPLSETNVGTNNIDNACRIANPFDDIFEVGSQDLKVRKIL
jgi:hypothetical protein